MVAHAPQSPDDPDLIAHEQTYHMVNVLVRWGTLHAASVIVFLTLWFATPAGFLGGLFGGVGVFALGYLMVVRHEEHQPLDPWTKDR